MQGFTEIAAGLRFPEGPVAMPDGSTAYTRAVNLKVLENGQLATSAGQPIRGEGGAPITVPADQQGRVSVLSDGTVNGSGGPLGRIALTRFDDESRVAPIGNNLLAGTGGRELSAEETRLRSGGLESSNVQPIVEMTRLIEVSRAYEQMAKMMDSTSDLSSRSIERLGRVQ